MVDFGAASRHSGKSKGAFTLKSMPSCPPPRVNNRGFCGISMSNSSFIWTFTWL